MNQKYIITGAPGTGKTSIINELYTRGYYCIKEFSREIILKQIKTKGNILPWKNQVAFENKVAKKRLNAYLSSPNNRICFFDRSIIDCIAYLKLNNLEITQEITKNMKTCNYNNIIFYTPLWEEIYTKDKERKENIKTAKSIEDAIINVYKKNNYTIIKIPKLSIKERADFVMSKI